MFLVFWINSTLKLRMIELRRLNNIKNIAETERMRQREGSPMSVLLKMSTYTLVRGFSKKKIVFF